MLLSGTDDAGRHNLVIVELTRFRYTEQLVFLNGTDATKGTVSRKHGTSAHFERLGAVVSPQVGTHAG